MGTVSTSITEESNNSKNTLFTFDLDSSYIAVDPGVVSVPNTAMLLAMLLAQL